MMSFAATASSPDRARTATAPTYGRWSNGSGANSCSWIRTSRCCRTTPDLDTAGVGMADAAGWRRMRWLRSVFLQAFALTVILIALPILVFAVLGNAEAERSQLIRNAVAETGDAIAAGIAPTLRDLHLAELPTLRRE